MGRWQSWVRPYEGYYDREPQDERVTRLEWAGGCLMFVALVALLVCGLHTCAWIDMHWLAGR